MHLDFMDLRLLVQAAEAGSLTRGARNNSLVSLSDTWASRERSLLVRDIDASPGCGHALIDHVLAACGPAAALP